MKKLVVLLLVSLMATSAFAVVDPDPDMLGIYFDMNADSNCLPSQPASAAFFAYAILTNPTVPGVEAFEFGYENVVPVGFETSLFQLATTLPSGAIDVGDGTPIQGNIIAGLAAPVPAAPATILVTWQYLPLAVFPMEMYLTASNPSSIPGGLPVIQAEGELMQVGLSTGGPEFPVATVNTGCAVATESDTWGGVKSLYR
jgi:hypothetical protein